MTIDLTSELDAFFGPTSDLATEASWQGSSLFGVFNNESGNALGVFGMRPTFMCKVADTDGIARGQIVKIGETSYRIADWSLDALNLVLTMVLERST